MAELNATDILERYRAKKTSEGRRECIRQLAEEYSCAPYQIAEFLRDAGCVVDKRLIRKTKPDLQDPDWIPYTKRGKAEQKPPEPEPPEPDPEPAPAKPGKKPSGKPGMTAGTLYDLLKSVNPNAAILDGDFNPIHRATLTAVFSEDGECETCGISLIS